MGIMGVVRVVVVLGIALMFPGGCSKTGGDGGTQFGSEVPNGGESGSGSKFGLTSNAALETTPAQLVFTNGVANTLGVLVRNVGTEGSITLTAAFIKTGNPAFTTSLPEEVTIGPLDFVSVEVSFTPGESSAGDTLVIEHTSGFQESIQVPIAVTDGSGFLSVNPFSLAFGAVVAGENSSLVLSIENIGSSSAPLTTIEFTQNTPSDFSIGNSSLPSALAVGEVLELTVVYTPDGDGSDIGELRLVGGEASEEFVIPVSGNVSGPQIIAIPGIIDFGYVGAGSDKEIEVTVKNVGTAAASVDFVALDTWSIPQLSVNNVPQGALSLEAGESTLVNVVFSPGTELPQTTDAIGSLVVTGTGTNNGALLVPIYGNISSPDILVSPVFVDFGLVASGDTVQRELTIINKGKEVLLVDSVLLGASTPTEFSILGFDPGDWSLPAALSPNESATVILVFTNTGAEGTVASGDVEIVSNDPDQPTLVVGMEAKRGGEKSCAIDVVPGSLNYAIVPHGFTKTMPLTLHNVGSGPCSYLSTTTYECGGELGIFGAGGCSQGIGGSSQYFKVVAQPPPIPSGILQGESVVVQVMFIPPDDAPLFDFFDTYQGAFQITVTDPTNGGNIVQSPVAASPEDLTANLVAQSGISDISVIPSTIDFGLVTIGCSAPEKKISIYNNGNAPLVISDITLENCTPEFEISQLPPIPPEGLEVSQASPVELYVSYKPQIPETSFCTLSIQSTDQDQALLTVPIQGTGTYDTEQTDEFTQLSGQMVDILFVVDDSGSMSEEQANLAQNFDALFQEAENWGTDFQMGVVTTDIDKTSVAGKLQGNPKIVTTGPSAETQFKDNVQVGDSGTGAQESGLEAANLALSMPLIYEGTNTSCAVDSDCDSYGTGLTCVSGKCVGWNAGFLRKDAALEVVFVSDEEDQSPGPLNFYIDFLKSIKGFANEGLMHAHAIVGDKGSGCNSSNGDAGAGDRYIEVANQTGGAVGSICDGNFATVLSSIGEVAFGLKVQFFLSASAQPGTVVVSVNGVGCPAGWTFEEDSNSVIFDSTGPCMPEEGHQISIYYKMLCLP